MPTIHSRVYMRPSTNIEFYQERQEFLDMVNTTYVATGRISEFRRRTFLDPNKLILEIRTTWADPSYMQNLKDEPLGEIELEAMRDYNIQHQIEFLYENDSSES
jgi:hypothetical protein